ncbi:pimelyl-[acyl-carrier protein] methyl esteresterase [Striga asiatica]|uniref:Pimelyl-[acyl-carrier protein] methyl esteresterase n=1 Tax=Striga asiatica TaxID=4170 RepID=A0A5A7NX29_STRAF|nr:pimelyl-[acyl-carrier protein] methyl esteresterase [Striga asiatica]
MQKVGSAHHNVTVLGSGETTVVLGHGSGCDQSVWKHLVLHLVDDYTVILYNDIGAGTTDPNLYDFKRCSSVDVERCIYVGHSLSPLVAAIVSISRPKLFRKVVMISATPRMANSKDYYGGTDQEAMDHMMAAFEKNPTSFYADMAPLMVGGSPDSVAVEEFKRTIAMERQNIALNRSRLILSYDLRPYLGQIIVPCHVIHNSKDAIVPVEVADVTPHFYLPKIRIKF